MITNEINSLILDIGSLKSKVGFSGEDKPRIILPSQIGIQYQQKSSESQDEHKMQEEKSEEKQKTLHIGETNISQKTEGMEIMSIYKNGEVQNWEEYIQFIQNIYESELKMSSKDINLLMSEFPVHNQRQREKICEVVFEQLGVPFFFTVKNAVLTSFSAGRSSSIVIDSGAYCTSAVPVHDGYVLQKNIIKHEIGGEYVNEKILNEYQFEQNEDFILTQSQQEFLKQSFARNIKEQGVLPDGNQIKFDKNLLCDAFFEPQSDILRFKGLHQMAFDSINLCEVELRKQLYNNVILAGGNSLLFELGNKFQSKLNDISNVKVKYIQYPSESDRQYSVWIGGSILASLGSFSQFLISKQEYQENGEFIVEKKCP